VGHAHRSYELDRLFVFRIPNVKGLTVLLLRAEMPPLENGARVRCLVGHAHRRYELDMLFVFRIPNVKGLTVLLLKQAMTIPLPREWVIYSHRVGPGGT
jgi:hypothetical protein